MNERVYTVTVTRLSPEGSHITYAVAGVERESMATVAYAVEQQMIKDALLPMPKGGSGSGANRKPPGSVGVDAINGEHKILVHIPYLYHEDSNIAKANTDKLRAKCFEWFTKMTGKATTPYQELDETNAKTGKSFKKRLYILDVQYAKQLEAGLKAIETEAQKVYFDRLPAFSELLKDK